MRKVTNNYEMWKKKLLRNKKNDDSVSRPKSHLSKLFRQYVQNLVAICINI